MARYNNTPKYETAADVAYRKSAEKKQQKDIEAARQAGIAEAQRASERNRQTVFTDISNTYKDILKAPELTDIDFSNKAPGGYGTTQDAFKKLLQSQMSGLEGFTSPEQTAIRSQQALQSQRGEALGRRQLAAQQAMGGMSGGAAAKGQQQLAQQMAANRAANEQSLAVANIEEKNRRLQAAQQAVTGAMGMETSQEQKQAFLNQLPGLTIAGMTEGALGRASSEDIAEATGEAGIDAAAAGKMCCFIFLEANDGILDRIARRSRDELMTDRNRRGYYKLSEVLIPLMRRYGWVKTAVKYFMVKPMIAAGRWKYGESKIGRVFAPVAYFWLGLFDYLGGEHPFKRENGEVV